MAPCRSGLFGFFGGLLCVAYSIVKHSPDPHEAGLASTDPTNGTHGVFCIVFGAKQKSVFFGSRALPEA